ncbi:MAG: hypothetical protein ACE5E0_00500, partial [Terriglobia bacterium]
MEKDKKVLGERQKRLRRRKRHVRIVAFVLVAAVPVVLWAAAIGFADELVVTTPDVGVHLPTPGPVMSAQWVMALGVRLAGAE